MATENIRPSGSRDRQVEQEDPRAQIIGRIWRMLIPVLALSIPFCALSRIGIVLPFFAIAAAAVATASIWFIRGTRDGAGHKENQRLQERIKELEERLANVETISRFEMQLAAREKAALEDAQIRSLSQSPQSQGQKENG